MATQSRVFAAALSFPILLGPGAVVLEAAETLSAPSPADASDAVFPDGLAGDPPAIPACDLPWDSFGEHDVVSGGSVLGGSSGTAVGGRAQADADRRRGSDAGITAPTVPCALHPPR